MRRKMKKRWNTGVLLFVLTAFLSGCAGKESNIEKENDVAAEMENEAETAEGTDQEETDREEAEVTELEAIERYDVDFDGRYAIGGKDVFFGFGDKIYRLDREKDEVEVLTSFSEDQEADSFEMKYDLYLSGEYLYYLRTTYDEETAEQTEKDIWKIDTRSGEKEKLGLDAEKITTLYVADQQLYYWYWDEEYNRKYKVYELDAEGNPGQPLTGKKEDLYFSMPQGYSEPCCGGYINYPYQISYFDKMLLQDEESAYVLYDPETKEEETIPDLGQVLYYDGKHLLYNVWAYDAEDGEEHFYYKDVISGQETEIPYRIRSVIGADQAGIYYAVYDEEGEILGPTTETISYARFEDLAEGKSGETARELTKSGYVKNSLNLFEQGFLTLHAGSYYALETIDADVVLKHVGMDETNPYERDCGTLASSKLKDFGEYTYTSGSETCPICGKLTLVYYQEGLSIDETKPGDAKINDTIQQNIENDTQVKLEEFKDEECDFHNDPFASEMCCNSFSSDVTVSYQSDDYVGLLYDVYEYYRGAAHGLPGRYFTLYDRNTGEELFLDDILATSGEELNAILVQKFQEYEYADDLSMDYIQEKAGFYTGHELQAGGFYLNEKGLVYFFGAYEVAGYAAGMPSVEIPYEDLEWKIDLY